MNSTIVPSKFWALIFLLFCRWDIFAWQGIILATAGIWYDTTGMFFLRKKILKRVTLIRYINRDHFNRILRISSALVICKVFSFVAFFQGISCCHFTKHVLSYVVYRKHLSQSCEIFIWSWFNWVSGISRENYPCAVNRKSCVEFPEEEEEELLCSVIWANNCINLFQDISLQAISWYHKR